MQETVLCAPSNPKSLYFCESGQKLGRHTPRAPVSGSEAGFLAGCHRGSVEPARFPSMRFSASVEVPDAPRPGMAGAACGAVPTRGSWWHLALRKGVPSALPHQGIVPTLAAPALENARFLGYFGPACSGTQHGPQEARTCGGPVGSLICSSALFPGCHMTGRDLVRAQVHHLEPEAAGVGGRASLGRQPGERPSVPGPKRRFRWPALFI